MINKIIAPVADQWAVVEIPSGRALYDAEYGGQLSSEDAYFKFTLNGKHTSRDYKVTISNLAMHDILYNSYALIDGQGYVMIPKEGIVWYNSQKEAEDAMSPMTSKDSLIDWLKKPLISDRKQDPDFISGYLSRTVSTNLFYIKKEGGIHPEKMSACYVPTRFTGVLVLVICCITGGIMYHHNK